MCISCVNIWDFSRDISMKLLRKCIAASLKILFWSLVLLMVIQCSAGMTISYLLSDFMVTDAGAPATGDLRPADLNGLKGLLWAFLR